MAMYIVRINYNSYGWPDYESAKAFADFWGVTVDVK